MTSFSLRDRLKSFHYAFNGLWHVVRTQHNAWIQMGVAFTVVVFGFWVQLSLADWKWLVATITLVWMAEVMNTAVEELSNVVSPDYHEGIKIAKDVAAAAVFVCACGAVIMGGLIFIPYFV